MAVVYTLFYPLMGALIGWLTNTIAIWMLFHPYEEKRIWRVRITFSPVNENKTVLIAIRLMKQHAPQPQGVTPPWGSMEP